MVKLAADSRTEALDRLEIQASSGNVIAAFIRSCDWTEVIPPKKTDDGYCRDEFTLLCGNTKKQQGCDSRAVKKKKKKRKKKNANLFHQIPVGSDSKLHRLVRTTVEEHDKNVFHHRLRQGICDLQMSRQPRQRNVLHRSEPFCEHGHDDSEPLVVALSNVFLDSACQAVVVSEHECWPLQTLLLNVRQRAASHVCFCQEMSKPLS